MNFPGEKVIAAVPSYGNIIHTYIFILQNKLLMTATEETKNEKAPKHKHLLAASIE